MTTNETTTDLHSAVLPRDEFSTTLRGLMNHPAAVVRTSTIDLTDFYGNVVTWHVKTIRAEGTDTVFLQRNTATGGDRMVLPAEVVAALVRQRDGAVTVTRRRAATKAAATREANGVTPAFLKGKKRAR